MPSQAQVKLVFPGDELAVAEEFVPGPGTYEANLVYVLAGGVGASSGALANHAGRFLAFGVTLRGAHVGARP